MKLVKILTIPAVLLASLVLAVPASAHALNNVTISVTCQTQTGTVCVELTGDIEQGNDERLVVVDLFDKAHLDKSLGEVTFDVPAFDSSPNATNHFDKTLCFPANTNSSITGFVVEVTKVTDKAGNAADLTITLKNSDQSIQFSAGPQTAAKVGDVGLCTATPPPPLSPSPSVQTVATLANTGGLDLRLPLIGLAVVVAGLALYVVSVGRGRSSSGR